jgi:predicted RNA binding protein with dsRBD fold (UPF0201 family)
MVKLKVLARVSETEDPERVRKAVRNLFPNINLEGETAKLDICDLKELRMKIRAKRIGSTVVGQLVKNKSGETTKLMLHRQAAFVGKVTLVGKDRDSPGGAIILELGWDEDFISWLTGVEKSRFPLKNRRLSPSL